MPSVNQNFRYVSGTNLSQPFTLLDANGAPINLGGATDIIFVGIVNDSIEVTKKLTLGSITLVTGGIAGQILVIFVPTDFPSLTGVFPFQIFVIDASGNVYEAIHSSSITVATSFRGAIT